MRDQRISKGWKLMRIRSSNWSYLGVMLCLVMAGLLVAGSLGGCAGKKGDEESSTDSGSGSGDGKAGGQQKALPPPKPLFKDWPENPAAVVVLTGEQHGYFEPCGCSLTQSGGLSRRADLFKQLAERKWPVTAFDLGDSLRRARVQSKYKFGTLLDALKDLRYAALALGPSELKLGPEYLLTQNTADPTQADSRPTFLGANVVLFGDPNTGTPVRTRVVTVGKLKIGVTSVIGKSIKPSVFPEGANSNIEILDPSATLPKAIEELKAQKPDLLVLLSFAKLEESRELAKQFPVFDVVQSAMGPEDGRDAPEKIGDKTWLWMVGHKGKYAGVIGCYPEDKTTPLRFELVDLDSRRFQDTPKMQDHMRYYQGMLRDNEAEIYSDMPRSSHPSGSTFVGAAKCGECHKKAFAKWKDSKHGQAYETLSKGRKGQEKDWIKRIHDPECLSCHVTGWDQENLSRYQSGFLPEKLAAEQQKPELFTLLKGQQCENCHGPGSKHVDMEVLWDKNRNESDLPKVTEERKSLKLTVAMAKERRTCYRCHDLDNSPGFNFDKYWEEIKHPWRD